MSEYYGVYSPSSDFFAHYGVKGMKWGVRKAVEKGNSKSLDRHYRKAAKKLEKLSKRADVETQRKQAKKWGKVAGASGAVALAGIGAMAGTNIHSRNLLGKARELDAAHKALMKADDKLLSSRIRDAERRLNLVAQHGPHNSYRQPYERDMAFNKLKKDFNDAVNADETIYDAKNAALKKDFDQVSNRMHTSTTIGKIASGVSAAGLLGSGIAGSKALAAKYRTTSKGHAKAVVDRNTWRNQMAETFKGTKYAGLPSVSKNNKRWRKSK